MDEDIHLKLSYLSLQCWLGRKPKDSRLVILQLLYNTQMEWKSLLRCKQNRRVHKHSMLVMLEKFEHNVERSVTECIAAIELLPVKLMGCVM